MSTNNENGPISNARLYRHKGRGSGPQPSVKRKRNNPPKGEPWTWHTIAMRESPAWRALTAAAKCVIERIESEHWRHGGQENGRLPVTFDNFAARGIRRQSVAEAIQIAETLGFIDVTERGHRGAADERKAARYGLTWFDRHDGTSRTNRWRHIETFAEAQSIVQDIRDRRRQVTEGRRRSRVEAEAAQP
jgi:hypothetical protein